MTHKGVSRLLKVTVGLGGTLALLLFLLIRYSDSYSGFPTPRRVTSRIPKLQQVSSSPSVSPSATEGSFGESVGRRFGERKAFLETMCRRMHVRGKVISKEFMDYNKDYGLLVCAPPKTGCSSMKRHLLRLAGFPEEADVHSDAANEAISVRYVLGDAVDEVLESPSTTRVTVARHPLDRLVSGYRDKFRDGAPVTRDIWADYLTEYRTSRGLDASNMTLTFLQYLEMIVYKMVTRGRSSTDRHIRPATLVCSPCSVKYDYVLHTDTLTQDLQYIAGKLNITEIDLGLRLNAKGGKVSSYEYYYKDIPPPLLSKIYALYREDFLLYNFELPPLMKRVLRDA